MRTARLVPLCLLIVVAPTLASGGRKPAGPTSQNARTNRGADPPRSPKPAKAAKPKFELKDGDRVVFLGNTLIERAQKYGYWETMLTARYPNRKIIFRNLGWDGDTVWAESRGLFDTPAKGYARLLAHVGRIKPTVIFLGYGNNEAFAGKPGLPRFIKQYNKLLDDLKKVSAKGVRFVLLSPYLLEKQPAPLPDPSETNQKISLYSAAIRHIAENRRQVLIDLVAYFERLKKSRPPLSVNGIQLNKRMWTRSAELLALTIEGSKETSLLPPVLGFNAAGKVLEASNYNIKNLKVSPNSEGIRFVATPMRIFPVYSVAFIGFQPGQYAVKIDGQRVDGKGRTFPSTIIAKKNQYSFFAFETVGDSAQYEKLRQAIIEKNRLYFHSWRPQNVTYLFLFRKHEQGQNAKEVKEFLKLVAAKEKEIDRLKKPVTRTYELIRVKPK